MDGNEPLWMAALMESCTKLYEKLSKLQWLLHRQHMAELAQYGPFSDTTRGKGRVLALLKLQQEISTKDLAYLLGIRQQSLNEQLTKLERDGYVERKPSQADRRVLLVSLTEKGRMVRQEEMDRQEIFRCLNKEELSTFEELLDRVIAALEEKNGAAPNDLASHWMQMHSSMQKRPVMPPSWMQEGREKYKKPFGENT